MNRKATQHEVTSWLQETPSHIIGDVTARDGIQAVPWYHFPTKENRAQLARQMMKAGIPHIEIGFPVMDADPETLAVRHVVEQTRDLVGGIFTLARLRSEDIEQSIRTLEGARNPGIHIFLGTSPFHREILHMSQENILATIPERVQQIRNAGMMCQFSAEDATRTEDEFLAQVYSTAEKSGAQILNVPDTVGHSDPDDYVRVLGIVRDATKSSIISAHCHNDMGCAEANAIVAIRRGLVQKIEGTIFGMGERAGNTDLSTLLIALLSHPEYREKVSHLIRHKKSLSSIMELVQAMTGYTTRPVQAGYGFDAIVNRSGVHQQKVAAMKESYVWIDPEQFGLRDRDLIDVGPLAGKAGIHHILEKLKIEYQEADLPIITGLIRSIFSPDTNIADVHRSFPQLDETEISKLSNKVQEIRLEARVLIPTVARQKEWRRKTQDIVRRAVRYFYGEK